MLNPPLSRLSSEQLGRIVEPLADDVDYEAAENLKQLSLVDRTFTPLCQSHLFKELRLYGSKSGMIKTLKRAYDILKGKESSAVSFVRTIRLELDGQKDASWLFQDQTFISLMAVLSKAPRPPYQLNIFRWNGTKAKNNELLVEGLARTFFSKSLTSLVITTSHIPASTLLISPFLKHLDLFNVSLLADTKLGSVDRAQLPEKPLPKLRVLDHRVSFDVIQRMLPRAGARQLADLSQLRVLYMSPEDEVNMTLAQPILDVAHQSLEEIHLLDPFVTDSEDEQEGYLLLGGLLDLQNLSRLRVLELRSGIYDSDADRLEVVKDITKVLSTIPSNNNLSRIYIRVQVFGSPPFQQMFDAAKAQGWRALAEEIVRIASGKRLRFELDMDVQNQDGDLLDHDRDSIPRRQVKGLYDHIENQVEPLRKVDCVHFNFQNELTSDI